MLVLIIEVFSRGILEGLSNPHDNHHVFGVRSFGTEPLLFRSTVSHRDFSDLGSVQGSSETGTLLVRSSSFLGPSSLLPANRVVESLFHSLVPRLRCVGPYETGNDPGTSPNRHVSDSRPVSVSSVSSVSPISPVPMGSRDGIVEGLSSRAVVYGTGDRQRYRSPLLRYLFGSYQK